MITFLKKPLVIVIILILVAGATAFFFTRNGNGLMYESAVAERGDITEEVSVTGKVKPAQSVNLAFETVGQISQTPVDAGDKVEKGDVLMKIDNSQLLANLAEARAEVASEQSTLDELRRGTRTEDIRVKEAELAEASQTLQNYYDSIPQRMEDAYAKSDDAVRIKTISIFTGSKSGTYNLAFNPCSIQIENDTELLRFQAEIKLETWRTEIDALLAAPSPEQTEHILTTAKSSLSLFSNFLEKTNAALTTECALAISSLNTPRESISTGRVNVVGALNDINNVGQNIASQKLTIERIARELDLKLAGTSEEQIAAQEARLAQAQARIANIQAQLEKAIIRSPIRGTITEKIPEVGEIVSAGEIVLSLISGDQFEIEANIPEADIAKVSINDEASLTLDAYGADVILKASVLRIDPAETVIEGVPTYLTTLVFSEPDPRVRSGMTADITIITDHAENVITIPARAIVRKDGKKIVRVPENGTIREIEVETGIRSPEGRIQITSGIKDGQEVITFLPEDR